MRSHLVDMWRISLAAVKAIFLETEIHVTACGLVDRLFNLLTLGRHSYDPLRLIMQLSPSALDTIMLDAHDQTKVNLDSLYLYPQGAVQIIQLIEVSPPTPNKFYPASLVTSSQSSEYSSESEYSEHSSDADVCSSYCSSEEAQEQIDSLRCDDEGAPRPDETYDIRATRVHAWRKKFADDMTYGTYIYLGTLPPALIDSLRIEALPVKRKSIDLTEVDDDTVSDIFFSFMLRSIAKSPFIDQVLLPHKRSRPDPEHLEELDTGIASMCVCAACDTSFISTHDLRHHGEASQASEACRAAVEYDFE